MSKPNLPVRAKPVVPSRPKSLVPNSPQFNKAKLISQKPRNAKLSGPIHDQDKQYFEQLLSPYMWDRFKSLETHTNEVKGHGQMVFDFINEYQLIEQNYSIALANLHSKYSFDASNKKSKFGLFEKKDPFLGEGPTFKSGWNSLVMSLQVFLSFFLPPLSSNSVK